MNAQTAASGSSASRASRIASSESLVPIDVATSNHASQTSIVPVAAANGTSHCDALTAQNAVAAKAQKSAQSKTTQATS
jgi:hypothetical protein